jgi:CRP-like cAMP-binding protein
LPGESFSAIIGISKQIKENAMISVKTLSALELFEGLPEEDLKKIAALSHEISFPAQTSIFSPEKNAEHILLVLKGTVGLTVHASPLAEPVTISVLNTPGQVFGFASVLGQPHHNSSALAMTEVKALAIDGDRLMDFLAAKPETGFLVMRRIAAVISRRLGTMRKLLLETIIDYERPASATPEN